MLFMCGRLVVGWSRSPILVFGPLNYLSLSLTPHLSSLFSRPVFCVIFSTSDLLTFSLSSHRSLTSVLKPPVLSSLVLRPSFAVPRTYSHLLNSYLYSFPASQSPIFSASKPPSFLASQLDYLRHHNKPNQLVQLNHPFNHPLFRVGRSLPRL